MTQMVLRNMLVPLSLVGDQTGFCGQVRNGLMQGDVQLENGRVIGMSPGSLDEEPTILMPKLVEPHCHLDKCHTVDRLSNVGGNLAQAIEEQRRDKANWTVADLRNRAQRGLAEYATAGTGLVRSHVDWGDTADAPWSWSVLLELAQESDAITLQLSALTSALAMADADYAQRLASFIPDGHALGMFVFDQPGHKDGIRNAFLQAQRLNLPLDFHVDEGLDPDLNGLETIADVALELDHQGPVLCGHAVSLAARDREAATRISDKLARAGISVAMLPSTNLYLQGRNGGTPKDRGVTLGHELVRAGVSLVLGCDNVRDAFCPVGRHDPMFALELGVMAAHLDPPFDRWLPGITTDAAHAIGHAPARINGAQLDDLLVAAAPDFSTLVCGSLLMPADNFVEVYA